LRGANLGFGNLCYYTSRGQNGQGGHFIKNRALLFPRWFVISNRQGEKVKKGKAKTMKNKTLHIPLMVIFGVGGIGALALAWGQPLSLSDRILPTFGGVIGLAWVLILAVLSRLTPAKPDTNRVQVIANDETETGSQIELKEGAE
jgi:hypothetical protein